MVVQLRHTLHFGELHIVTVLERVTLVFMHSHNSLLVLRNVRHNKLLGLFAVSIVDLEFGSIVKEDVSAGTKSFSKDDSAAVSAHLFKHVNAVLDSIWETFEDGLQVGDHDYVELFGAVWGHLRDDIH